MALKAGENDRGTIAMARTLGRPHSATAQFFINHVNNDMLNPSLFVTAGAMSPWSRRLSGLDVLDKIAGVADVAEGMHQNVPQTTVTIEKSRCSGKKWVSSGTSNSPPITANSPRHRRGERPKTAANFLQYVRDGHYDNTIFTV